MFKWKFCLIVGAVFLLCSCAPKKFIPKEPPPVVFDKTPEYSVDLSTIPKPDKLVPVFVDENFEETTMDKAKYVLLTPQEYAKVGAVVKLAKAYKEIVKEQEVLINTDIQIINSLKEYIAMEQMKAKAYRDLWADSENAYRQEQYNHKIEQAATKGLFGTIAIGAIIALIIAL